jgi:hypothetical protein
VIAGAVTFSFLAVAGIYATAIGGLLSSQGGGP